MSRQAHMELLLKSGVNVGLGDTVFYVNNGERKSHGDVQKKGDVLLLNCYLVNEKDIEQNPDMLGEYNVPRYLTAFNKRIEPLLVVFSPKIREEILVEDPEKRPYFTKTQTQLVRGFPRRDGDQDNIDEVLTLSDGEIAFWRHREIDPYYMYLDSTMELVNGEYIAKNKDLIYGDYEVKTQIPKDELYEMDENGDYLIYSL